MNKIRNFKKGLILSLFLLSLLFIIPGCPDEPNEPTEDWYSIKIFPYVFCNASYTSYINLYNNGQSILEAEIIWYDSLGTVIHTETRMIQPYAIYRFTRANFTGWVYIRGRGSKNATEAQLEIRESGDNGLALAMPASSLLGMSVCWFFHQAVTDLGPGQERTTIVTANHNYTFSLYIRYNSSGVDYCSPFEVEIPPKALHIFKPLDVWGANFPQGMTDVTISVSGNTGPDGSGTQASNYTGVIVREKPGEDISILNYKVPDAYWSQEERANAYLVDVRDTETTRFDRIYLKNNNASNYPYPMQNYKLHFYDYYGNEVSGSPQIIELVDHFDSSGSHTIISPRELLGQPFSGSIWIRPIGDFSDWPPMEVRVLRQWPGKWIDLAEDANGKSPDWDWEGVIPYVSSSADPWDYSAAFFYPVSLYSVDGTPDIESDTYGSPGTTPPDAENGVVVMTFRDDSGNDMGWFAFYMNPNETRIIDIEQLSEIYLGPFTGSICYQPMLPQQLEIWHNLNQGHGTAGYLR